MEVEFLCPGCGKAGSVEASDAATGVQCTGCRQDFGPLSRFSSDQTGIRYCGICGCRDLYTQKDFNRKIGCGIAAAGAVLAPFTKFLSLLICALIDLVLYAVLPVITICYGCNAIYREFPKNPNHEGFNLGINDRYRAAERK